MDKLYRHGPSPTADATLFMRFAHTSPNAKTPGRLRTFELKSDGLSLFSSELRGHIRSVERERGELFVQLTEISSDPTCSLMGECPSLKAKRDSSQKAEELLRRIPSLDCGI
jgi:hypothetical protein